MYPFVLNENHVSLLYENRQNAIKDCQPTSTCTPKISWQVKDFYNNWIERKYDASLYLEETEPGKFCTKNEDGFVEASLCRGPKDDSSIPSNWGLSSSWVRNLTYTDCDGNVTSASNVELTRRTGTCASGINNSWRVWFKTCFDTTPPTPSPSQSPSESYVKPDDTLFAIGNNQHLIDSSKTTTLLYPEPTTVNNSGDNILQFEVFDGGNLILKEDGSLWSGGNIIKTNEDAKYHPQTGFYRGEFYKVDDGIEYIKASNWGIYFKRVNDNKLYARPMSYHGYAQSAIGLENDNNTSLPEYPQVVIKDDDSPLENIVQISIEHKLTVFRTSDGKVYGAGQDDAQWNVFGLDSKPKTKATLLATEDLEGNTISAVLLRIMVF